tara:strand:+ start:1941 stop:2192 length:252 start_codon:yes stop_codon:yes gene_type:complete
LQVYESSTITTEEDTYSKNYVNGLKSEILISFIKCVQVYKDEQQQYPSIHQSLQISSSVFLDLIVLLLHLLKPFELTPFILLN